MRHIRRALPVLSMTGILLMFTVSCASTGGDSDRGGNTSNGKSAPRLTAYPDAPKSDIVDVYHGVEVPDPFRPLEDPDAPETRVWIEAQNEVTGAYLDGIREREHFRQRLTDLWNYERFGLPHKAGGRYFWSYNDGLSDQNLIYVADSLEGEPRVLFDPNELSEDGTVANVNATFCRLFGRPRDEILALAGDVEVSST